MRSAFLLSGALMLTCGALASTIMPAPPAAEAQAAPQWLNSYPAAQEAARKSGKPIFLVFR